VPTGGGRLTESTGRNPSVEVRHGTIPKSGGSAIVSGDSLEDPVSGSADQTDVVGGSRVAVRAERQTTIAPARTRATFTANAQ